MSKKRTDDESLADVSDAPADDDLELVEAPESKPEDFDIATAAAGVRATRIRVHIQPGAHLLERVQELAEEIDSYPNDDDVPVDLADEWVETWEAFNRKDVYVLEGRSSDWIKQHKRDVKKRGIDPDRKGLSDQERVAHTKRLVMSQIAAQIVKPEGVNEADVAAIFAGNEAEGDKLWRAMNQVNTQPVKQLVPDFSPRVSRLSRNGSR